MQPTRLRGPLTLLYGLMLLVGSLVACTPKAPKEQRLLDKITTQLPGDFTEVAVKQLSKVNHGFFGQEVDYSPDQNHSLIVRAAYYEVGFERKDLPKWLNDTAADARQLDGFETLRASTVRVINDTPWAIIEYTLRTDDGPAIHRQYATSYSGQMLFFLLMVNPDGAERYPALRQLTEAHLTVE